MKVGVIYRNDRMDLTMTVLAVTEKDVTVQMSDSYQPSRRVVFDREGFVKSLGTGRYIIVKR